LKPCPDYQKETGNCLKHERELEKLNKEYGCIKVLGQSSNMKELVEAIKSKLKEKSFVNLHFIKIKDGSIVPHQRLVFLRDVLGLLDAYVIVPRKQLLSLRDASMKADEKLGIESLATHILVDLLDGKLEG